LSTIALNVFGFEHSSGLSSLHNRKLYLLQSVMCHGLLSSASNTGDAD